MLRFESKLINSSSFVVTAAPSKLIIVDSHHPLLGCHVQSSFSTNISEKFQNIFLWSLLQLWNWFLSLTPTGCYLCLRWWCLWWCFGNRCRCWWWWWWWCLWHWRTNCSNLAKTVVNGQVGGKLIISCRKIAKWGIFGVYGYGGDVGRLKTAMKPKSETMYLIFL